MKIVLATGNQGKVRELRALLAEIPVELIPLSHLKNAPVVDEDQPTLRGNARKKAWALHEHTGLPALADDSGLEVRALGGEPGIRSARFAGEQADDAANRRHLLERMHQAQDRAARFRTVVALADEGRVLYISGTCHGTILEQERGAGGFGYDPIFLPDGFDITFAEMSDEQKNAISHRGNALAAVRAYLHRKLAPAR